MKNSKEFVFVGHFETVDGTPVSSAEVSMNLNCRYVQVLTDLGRVHIKTMPDPRRTGRNRQRTGNTEDITYTSLDGSKTFKLHTIFYYSDVLFLLQQMTDTEVMKKLSGRYRKRQIEKGYRTLKYVPEPSSMAPATFYRHKKRMMESSWYKSLDKNRLDDLDYLHSVPGDDAF